MLNLEISGKHHFIIMTIIIIIIVCYYSIRPIYMPRPALQWPPYEQYLILMGRRPSTDKTSRRRMQKIRVWPLSEHFEIKEWVSNITRRRFNLQFLWFLHYGFQLHTLRLLSQINFIWPISENNVFLASLWCHSGMT